MKVKVGILITIILFTTSILTYSYFYLNDAKNYISVTKIKEDMGTEYYNELLSYFSASGFDEDDFNQYIKNHQQELQQQLDSSTYLEKINLYIYYDSSIKEQTNSTLIKNEVEFINSLDEKEKENYNEIVERLIFNE